MKHRCKIINIKSDVNYFESHRELIVTFLICLVISSCNQSPMTLTLQHRQILSGIPSASGIVKIDTAIYVIGDNSAFLYQLKENFEVIDRKLLLEGITDSILPKISKPDFEAIASIEKNGKTELLIFGSGSKSPERDVLARVGITKAFPITVYDLTDLYNSLRSSSDLNAQSLNIEAATVVDDILFLFNRENNLLLEYSLNEILGFLEGKEGLPTYKSYKIILPQLNGLNAKFSGASTIPNSQKLVFTASLEDTPNTYDDGEVLGSYVGIIDIEDLKDGYQPLCISLTDNLEPIAIKVESVEVLQTIGTNELKLVLVTDSDGGESELLLCTLTF